MNPASVDLRPAVEVVEDQGQVGDCTANGAVEAIQVCYERVGQDIALSLYDLYYRSQLREGIVGQEGVKNLADVAYVLQNHGVCLYSSWPSVPANLNAPAPAAFDAEAAQYKILSFNEPNNTLPAADQVTAIKTFVAKGVPVVFSCFLTQSFAAVTGPWRNQTFDVKPSLSNPMIGQPCMLIIGYDDAAQMLLVQNSWGVSWGDGGFCGIPYTSLPSMMLDHYVWDKLSIPFVNAGWAPDTIDQFDTLMDWAEKTYALAPSKTQTFAQYFYRGYPVSPFATGAVNIGLDTTRSEIVLDDCTTGVFSDVGTFAEWLAKVPA